MHILTGVQLNSAMNSVFCYRLNLFLANRFRNFKLKWVLIVDVLQSVSAILANFI